jgi:hypothetical protein
MSSLFFPVDKSISCGEIQQPKLTDAWKSLLGKAG